MDAETVFRLFTVDFENGRLHWKSPPIRHPRLLGQEAGGARAGSGRKSYWVVKIGGVAFKRGRLIFVAAYGREPSEMLDHINGNSLDDRLSNIREATALENARNRSPNHARTDLPMGVRLTHAGRFQARIRLPNRSVSLGCFGTSGEARSAYLKARKELFGEFA